MAKTEEQIGTKQLTVLRAEVGYIAAVLRVVHLLQNPPTKEYIASMTQGSGGGGKVTRHQDVKEPLAEFNAKVKRLPNGMYVHPAEAFAGKNGCLVLAARQAKLRKISASLVVQTVKVDPDAVYPFWDQARPYLYLIDSNDPVLNTHVGRIEKSQKKFVPVPIHRPGFEECYILLRLRYRPHLIGQSSLLTLLEAATDVGLGAYRSENGGTNGSFSIVSAMQMSGFESFWEKGGTQENHTADPAKVASYVAAAVKRAKEKAG